MAAAARPRAGRVTRQQLAAAASRRRTRPASSREPRRPRPPPRGIGEHLLAQRILEQRGATSTPPAAMLPAAAHRRVATLAAHTRIRFPLFTAPGPRQLHARRLWDGAVEQADGKLGGEAKLSNFAPPV